MTECTSATMRGRWTHTSRAFFQLINVDAQRLYEPVDCKVWDVRSRVLSQVTSHKKSALNLHTWFVPQAIDENALCARTQNGHNGRRGAATLADLAGARQLRRATWQNAHRAAPVATVAIDKSVIATPNSTSPPSS